MRKLWLALLTGVLMTSMLFGGTAVFAQENQGEEIQLPDPGILPDSPFYVFDNLGKSMGLFFTTGPEAKAQKALQYAEERLAEALAMAAKNNSQGLEKATNGYDKFATIAAEKIEEATQKGVADDFELPPEILSSKHLAVLDGVAESFPEAVPQQARQAISRAREASMKGAESALKGLAQDNPEKAAEIAMNAAGERANRAKAKAEENDVEEVEEAVGEAEKLFEFGTEISAIAKGIGKGETTVDQLIARATAVHLDVLVEIYQKVPEQAKSAIEDAMTKAVTTRENVVKRLKGAGALGNIPEELPVPREIPDSVKEQLSNIGPGSTGNARR
jgi:hypothetical protein